MIDYEIAFLIACLAYVYSVVLTDANQLLNPLYKRLYIYFKTDERINEGKDYHWLFKILIHCEKCVSGQWALWTYLAMNYLNYNFFYHLFFISYTITITILITKYTKNERT